MSLATFKGGRALAALFLFGVVLQGCDLGASRWSLEADRTMVRIRAPISAARCVVVLNSAEGGFHRLGRVDIEAGDALELPLVEFQDSRGNPVLEVRDALVQCQAPAVTQTLRRRS